uniref:Uncharacterized protein n=1 Tax=viral metagenome TaxID=1070528 RepID=A0A6H1ZNG7_9ZZZZ
MPKYFIRLSDNEIELEIGKLTPFQHKIFAQAVNEGKDRRHALFLARTWAVNRLG